MEIYRIENLSFTYPLARDRQALDKINMVVKSGEFISICGKSGSGKSSLIRQLKTSLAPHGEREGKIYFKGQILDEVDDRTQVSDIGYVLQNPDNQIVTDKVWHELAFGLESLGYDSETIRLRVAEMASYFGIHKWFDKKVDELSGGQKQILNLAGIMAMQPSVLILDEPTSQLDPIAASDFINTIEKINTELGTTIIMTEHRLEEILPVTDRLIVMDEGKIISEGRPADVGEDLYKKEHPMFKSMTSAMQVYAGLDLNGNYPITVNEGRNIVNQILEDKEIPGNLFTDKLKEEGEIQKESFIKNINPKNLFRREARDPNLVIELDDVWFKYEKNLDNVLKGLSLKVKKGELYCILGGNGTGKSTMLSLISGIRKAYRGKVYINGKDIVEMSNEEKYEKNLGVLPQNPQNLFVKNTVKEDLYEILSDRDLSEEDKEGKIREVVELTELGHLLEMHPYDLSGGEQQRAALAKVLLLEPKILLLDEPTKGLDNFYKEKLAKILDSLKDKGVSIVMVSHDIEFCARHGDTCAMVFNGEIISEKKTRDFFAGNNFYTTSANRMIRNRCKEAITIEDVIRLCQLAK